MISHPPPDMVLQKDGDAIKMQYSQIDRKLKCHNTESAPKNGIPGRSDAKGA
jgi:hypothetical protein